MNWETKKTASAALLFVLFVFLSGCLEDTKSKVILLNLDSNSTTTNQVKVTANDINAGYLFSKLTQGPNITLAVLNPGANETVQISSTGSSSSDSNKVMVSSADTNASFLFSKLQAGTNVSLSIVNPGADEKVRIDANGSTGDTNNLNWPELNKVIPWQDTNIFSASRWNADVNWQEISLLFPVPDSNILNSIRYLQDATCDNNASCRLLATTIVWDNNGVLDGRYVNITGDIMTGSLVINADENINAGTLTISVSDRNAITITNTTTGLPVFWIDQNGNATIDGNFFAKDANTYVGAPTGAGNNDLIFTGFNYTAHPGTNGASLLVDNDTYVFGSVNSQNTGQFFSNTNKANEIHAAGVVVAQTFFAGPRDGAWWNIPRSTNPTGASQNKDGIQFIKDFQNSFDSNQPYIKRNGIYESLFAKITTGTPRDNIKDANWVVDVNGSGDWDLNGSFKATNDSNFGAQVKIVSCLYIGLTSLCPNNDSNGGLVITG